MIKWKFDPGVDRAWAGDVACCGVNNRGVALWKDKVISIALDGRMFAINKATGEMVWERKIADPAIGETLTIAPLVIRDLAIVGAAGGEFGIRGWIDATDLNTGKQAWRTYTIPGRRRARQRDLEGRQGALEARRRLGLGDRDLRPATPTRSTRASAMPAPTAMPNIARATTNGRRACSRSIPNDGKIKWGFQYTPNDPYDYDEISEHPIIDAKVNGEDRKLVVHAARNGFYYALDRTNGSFVAGKQYVDQLNWTTGPRSQDRPAAQLRSQQGRADLRAGQPRHARQADGDKLCPSHFRRQELGAVRLQSRARTCSTSRRSKAATQIETVEQKDFVDQGGT